MTGKQEKKDYCDAKDQRQVVEKMIACDEAAVSDGETAECYARVLKEDKGCMSS